LKPSSFGTLTLRHTAAARLVRAQLYGIAPDDPRILLIAAATFLATVLAASLLPALRASRVLPFEALREE
jgi:putative ABC transport system permease protein